MQRFLKLFPQGLAYFLSSLVHVNLKNVNAKRNTHTSNLLRYAYLLCYSPFLLECIPPTISYRKIAFKNLVKSRKCSVLLSRSSSLSICI